MKKAIVSFILAVILIATTGIEAFAASSTTTVATIHDFSSSTTISGTAYNIIRTGKISMAKTKDNVLYYKFTKDEKVVYVEVNAFKNSVGNSYSTLNQKLSSGLNTGDGSKYGKSQIIKKRATGSSNVNNVNGGTSKRYSYKTYLGNYETYSLRAGNNVVLKTKVTTAVVFVYSNLIRVSTNSATIRYKAPSTSSEYLKALSREDAKNNNYTVSPKFTVNVVKPGSAKATLSYCKVAGKGILENKDNLSKYIELGFALGKVLAEGYENGVASLKTMYDFGMKCSELMPKSEEYTSREVTALASSGKRCAKARFTCPFKMKQANDYFQVELTLSSTPSTSGIKSQYSVSFSI